MQLDSFLSEYFQFRSFISTKAALSNEELFSHVWTYLSKKLPNIMLADEYYYSLPCSNAEVERGFSTLSNIKTDKRNRLLDTSLNDFMTISLNGKNIEDFNYYAAYSIWKSDKQRRLINSMQK